MHQEHSPSVSQRLPTTFLRRVESFFAADFSTVRVHLAPRERCLGYDALALGEDIYVAGPSLEVELLRVQRILVHELTHVLQQRAGRVRRTEPGEGVTLDPLLELEAELAAERWVHGEAACGLATGGFSRPAGTRQPGLAAQPYLELQVEDRLEKKVSDAGKIWKEISDNLKGEDQRALSANWNSKSKKELLLGVLKYWIDAPKAANVQREDKQIALTRIYKSYEDLARAVLCQVDANYYTSSIEDMMAKEVMKSAEVRKLLVSFIADSLRTWMKKNSSLSLKIESGEGRYLKYVVTKKQQSLKSILGKPGVEQIGALISAIHDVTDILWNDAEEGKKIVTIPDEKFKGLVYNENEHRYEPKLIKQGFRGEGATAVVTHLQVNAGMRLGFSLCLGPSNTTGRMLMLAEACKASKEEKEAIAWAIFAFWNVEYRRDLTEIHGFHHVMDMAANFEVPYDPTALPKPPLGNLTDKFPKMVKEVREQVKKLEQLRRKPVPLLLEMELKPMELKPVESLDSLILRTLKESGKASMDVIHDRPAKLKLQFGRDITKTEYADAFNKLLSEKKISSKSTKSRVWMLE